MGPKPRAGICADQRIRDQQHGKAGGLRHPHSVPEAVWRESDGNTMHILSSRISKDNTGKELDYAELWYAEFELPTI